MSANNIVRPTALLAIVSLLASACGGKDAQPDNSAPAREIQLAPAPAAQPQLNDVPVKTASAPRKAAPPKAEPAPEPTPPTLHVQVSPIAQQPVAVAAAPAPASSGPAPVPTGTVGTGTSFSVHPVAKVCTSTHKVGDRFTATLTEAVQGSSGATIPAGSSVTLRVVESTRSENSKDSIKFVFDVISVRVGDESYLVDARVQSPPIEKVRAQSTGDQAKKVAAGAAIGAILGQVLGRNTKSTVIGGAVGAAAGGAVAAGTADYDGCVNPASPLTITLNRPLTIKTGAGPSAPF